MCIGWKITFKINCANQQKWRSEKQSTTLRTERYQRQKRTNIFWACLCMWTQYNSSMDTDLHNTSWKKQLLLILLLFFHWIIQCQNPNSSLRSRGSGNRLGYLPIRRSVIRFPAPPALLEVSRRSDKDLLRALVLKADEAPPRGGNRELIEKQPLTWTMTQSFIPSPWHAG